MEIARDIIETIFGLALFINSLLFIPQAYRIFKQKTAKGVSLITFVGFILIQFAIFLHGLIIHDYILVSGYILSMIACGTVISLILFYRKRGQHESAEDDISLAEVIAQFPENVYWKNRSHLFIKGKALYDIFSKEEAERHYIIDEEVMETGKMQVIEGFSKRTDGTKTLYLSYKVPLKNKISKTFGLLSLSIDTSTATQEAQDRLDMLENIIAVMPGHVYWVNKNGVYLGCNDNQARAAGLSSRKEIIGRQSKDLPWNLNAESNLNRLDEVNKEIMSTGDAVLLEEPRNLPNGTKAVFLSNKVPLYNNRHEINGMLGISLDISDRKEVENLRLEKALVEQKEKVAKMMAGGIAHELRTPLARAGLIGEKLGRVMPSLVQAYQIASDQSLINNNLTASQLELAKEAGQRLQQIVHSANVFINMMLMKVNLEKCSNVQLAPLSLVTAITETLSAYPFQADDREMLNWQAEKYQPEDFYFRGNVELFQHLFFNLIKNALYHIKAAQRGQIEIWLESDANHHLLHFKDTGPGIKAEYLPYIFELFFTKTPHGTGVGLALCKMIMKEFKGEIQCDSVEGEYTHFVLHFPKILK